ncbi:helix-turn-helix domain-containing protein [Lentzea sp. NPDC092896]|uniref:helix-turn-helix domain-containing protein n=1 Tax=Lentzea sp. NPDC092896 TaxID=3364127 RepID=UPI0038034AE7
MRLIVRPRLIRQLMEVHGLSIQRTAELVGTSKTTIEQLRSGQRIDTDEKVAARFAQALQVESDALFIKIRESLSEETLAA